MVVGRPIPPAGAVACAFAAGVPDEAAAPTLLVPGSGTFPIRRPIACRAEIPRFGTGIRGSEQQSELERGLIRQAAALALRAEQLQATIVRGDSVDDDHLIRLSGEARQDHAAQVIRHAF
ncbi:hypothetical protein [Bradyrhizobium sp. CCBAU 45394]|uniref:hypothetical protein n=1 Tax=Bradyrhizobium sp. CCBAU 45394 TaxID=1325087 RepID=UPI0023027016|nr:hypothetical protein [Bradyrhizobium sp. CCBAU 45394]